jgi:hypothetical protein
LINQEQTREKEKIIPQYYRLRHFRTGRVLSFEDQFDGKDQVVRNPILAQHCDEQGGGHTEKASLL